MPFTPKYQITNKMLEYVGAIDSAREVITSAPLVPAWERRFQSEARNLIIHHGTHLEGNDLNLEEVEQIIEPSPARPDTPGVKGSHTPGVFESPLPARERDV